MQVDLQVSSLGAEDRKLLRDPFITQLFSLEFNLLTPGQLEFSQSPVLNGLGVKSTVAVLTWNIARISENSIPFYFRP